MLKNLVKISVTTSTNTRLCGLEWKEPYAHVIHFKIMVFDMKAVYIGSANLTGAAFGMKSERNRNFEAGIFTDEPSLVNAAIEQFDEVWIGSFCKKCGRKDVCKDRIA